MSTETSIADEAVEDISSRQFVTFQVIGEVFAVAMAPVQEIIRVPQVVRVPLAPTTLEGLANLRGKILPIVSLRRIFACEENAADDATRALVIDVGQPLGFIVDKVSSVIEVADQSIEDSAGLRAGVAAEFVSGVIKGHPTCDLIMLLDFDKLISSEFQALINKVKHAVHSSAGEPLDVEVEEASDELQLVSFTLADEEYAVALEDVQEIVQMPERVVAVPKAPPHVVGVMNLRNRLLPLIDLRRLFSLTASSMDEKTRIVVLTSGIYSVGLVVDAVSEVLNVPAALIDPIPPLLARHQDLTDITQICRLDNGKRMVSVLVAHELLNNSATQEALGALGEVSVMQESSDEHDSQLLDDDEQLVVFRLGNEEFAVPIHSVQEIVRVPEQLIRVPQTPDFVEGVINLRGSVLPVVDLRTRLHLPRIERQDRQRIMVFTLASVRTGFIVDQVSEVLKVAKNIIDATPQMSQSNPGLLVRIANIQKHKRLVQLIEPELLLKMDENSALQAAVQ